MKVKLRIAAGIIIALISSSCTKDEFKPWQWGIEPELEVSPLAVILTPSHNCDTVKVKTNYIDFNISESLYWIEIERMEDTPAIIVKSKNPTTDDMREGYVTVTVKRGKHEMSRDFVVIQFKDDIR